ncbi:MAG: hypothetical protein A2293_04975 [Elusimicrobia bacterium RIFOXYB2_FULL_49_7]|nr:MAG: hypothetical protein A2293_04975 [Elusimicrobia bacterium RIFOXYB2_FULL_49_7]
MIEKKRMKQEYKNKVSEKGIYAIRNKVNGKVFLASTLNLYNIVERTKFRLSLGNYPSEQLLKDWKSYGEESFEFEILEKLPLKDDGAYNYDEDLKILEMIWVEKYQPLAEKCYNERESIRMV